MFAAVAGQSNQSTAIDIESVNITDEEKEKLKTSHEGASSITPEASDRPFLDTVLSALDCTENDYLALLSLCLIYALAHNKGNLNATILLLTYLCVDCYFLASKSVICKKCIECFV